MRIANRSYSKPFKLLLELDEFRFTFGFKFTSFIPKNIAIWQQIMDILKIGDSKEIFIVSISSLIWMCLHDTKQTLLYKRATTTNAMQRIV